MIINQLRALSTKIERAFQLVLLTGASPFSVVANGYPDLRVNGVLGGSVEGLDVQVLLDPLEEQLNPGNIGRNIATLIGKNIAGVGTVF